MARASTAKKTKSKTKSKLSRVAKKKTKMPTRSAKKKTKSKTKVKAKAKTAAKKVTKKSAHKKTAKKAVKQTQTSSRMAASKKYTAPQPALPVSLAAATAPEAKRIGAGEMAPAFTLPDQNGKSVSLSDFRGKKVILYFYPKDDTPGCTKEACSFRDNLPHFQAKDTEILGISFDDAFSHQKFISKYGLNFHLLSDLEKKVAQDYGVYVQKNMYGNISWGIERSTFVIDREGKIVAAIRRVQVDGHTDEVMSILNNIA